MSHLRDVHVAYASSVSAIRSGREVEWTTPVSFRAEEWFERRMFRGVRWPGQRDCSILAGGYVCTTPSSAAGIVSWSCTSTVIVTEGVFLPIDRCIGRSVLS
jgi:hypothetical protein